MNSQVRRSILDRDGWKCRFCGHDDPRNLTIDHIIPISRGGHPVKKANLVAACFFCNQRKANRTPEEAGMVIISEGYSYTPPGKLDDNVDEVAVLITINTGAGKKRRKRRERIRRKEMVRFWQRNGFLPDDLSQFDLI